MVVIAEAEIVSAGTSDLMKPIRLPAFVIFPEALVIPAVHKDHGTVFLALRQRGVHARALIVGAMGDVMGRYQEEQMPGCDEKFYIINGHQVRLDAGNRWEKAW